MLNCHSQQTQNEKSFNSFAILNKHACLWTVGGNQSTHKNTTQTTGSTWKRYTSGSQTAGKVPTGRTQRYSRGPQKIRQKNSEVKLNGMNIFLMKNEPKQLADAIVMMFHFFLKSLMVIFFISQCTKCFQLVVEPSPAR